MKRLLIHRLLRKRREKKIREKWKNDKIKILFGINKFKIRNSFKKLDEIYTDQENLEDLLSLPIKHIEKRSRLWGVDDYFLFVKDFKSHKNYQFKKIEKDTIYLGNDYNDKEIKENMNEAQSILILARPGGGKTTTAKIQANYHQQMIEKHYPKLDVHKLVIDPKGMDFINWIDPKRDHFFRLDSKESYEKLSELLETIINEAKKATRNNKMSSKNWIIIIDEILLAFNKDGPAGADKEYKELIKKITNQIEEILVSWARVNRFLIIAMSQSYSVQDSSVNLRRFGAKLLSRPQNKTSLTPFGVGKIGMRPDLKRGRFLILDKEDVITQFPQSLKAEKKKHKKSLMNELKRVKLVKTLSQSIKACQESFKENVNLYRRERTKMDYRAFMKANYQSFYENYGLPRCGTEKRDLLKYKGIKERSDHIFIMEREFQIKNILRRLFVSGTKIKYDKKTNTFNFKI